MVNTSDCWYWWLKRRVSAKKNPAYERHQISRPMWIVAQIFFFFFIRRLQIMDLFRVLINEKVSGVKFFHQEIARHGPLQSSDDTKFWWPSGVNLDKNKIAGYRPFQWDTAFCWDFLHISLDAKQKIAPGDIYIYPNIQPWTSRLLDQIGQVGWFSENLSSLQKKHCWTNHKLMPEFLFFP